MEIDGKSVGFVFARGAPSPFFSVRAWAKIMKFFGKCCFQCVLQQVQISQSNEMCTRPAACVLDFLGPENISQAESPEQENHGRPLRLSIHSSRCFM